jgi:hypothetical protein
MGVSSTLSAFNLVFSSVVAYSCNSPVLPSETIYNLPDKLLELKSEYSFVQFQKVSLTSFQRPIR